MPRPRWLGGGGGAAGPAGKAKGNERDGEEGLVMNIVDKHPSPEPGVLQHPPTPSTTAQSGVPSSIQIQIQTGSYAGSETPLIQQYQHRPTPIHASSSSESAGGHPARPTASPSTGWTTPLPTPLDDNLDLEAGDGKLALSFPISPIPSPLLHDGETGQSKAGPGAAADTGHPHPASGKKKKTKLLSGKRTNTTRMILREPITTITSSILGLKKQQQQQQLPISHSHSPAVNGDGGSSVASGQTMNGMVSVEAVSSKHSLDHELGYNDGRANEGVLSRVYDTWSLTAIATSNIGPIAGAFFGVHTAKEYGGYSMLAIGWPLSGIFMCLFAAVIAEMSSSYPVAGAMYTWTFRLCRLSPSLRSLARFLSWLSGSLLLCGHILAQMVIEWQIAVTFQGLIVMLAPAYQPETWKTIGFAWAGLLVSAGIASTSVGRKPALWKGVSGLMLLTIVAIIASVFACAPYRNSASYIFTNYENGTGFSRKGYVYLLGWVLTSIATGYDVAAHLAEEAKYPTSAVPKAIFWSTALSYIIGWILMLSLMVVSHEAVSADAMPARDYGAPAQMLTSVLPRGLAFFILALVLCTMQFQDVAQLLASSRFVWALARDSALPLSTYFRRLSRTSRIPVRATWAICAVAAPSLMLIATDRAIATSLMLQGCGAALVLAYAFPVLVYLTCEKGALDVDGRNEWTLRNYSKPVACAGLAYIALILILMSCPNGSPITATSFSYAPVVLVVVLLLSSLTWILYGNAHYAGPIKSITIYTVGREVDLPKSGRKHPGKTSSAKPATPAAAAYPALSSGALRAGAGAGAGVSGCTTTQLEVGKTANLFCESLTDVRWAGQEDDDKSAVVSRAGTDADTGTEYTETGFTDSRLSGESWSGSESGSSEGNSESESDRRPPSRPQPARLRSAV